MEINKVVSQSTATVQTKPATETDVSPRTPTGGGTAVSSKPAGDTVQISSAAKKLQQEATETAAQTAMEAGKGDPQAKKLLAKEEASKEKSEPHRETEPKGGNLEGVKSSV